MWKRIFEVTKLFSLHFIRGFDVCKSVKKPLEHITGRKCDDCGGDLSKMPLNKINID